MTVDQLLENMKDGKIKRVKKFKDLAKSMLFDASDVDYEKIKPGTSYYNGHPDYYPNCALMTYCNVFCYLFLQRLGINIDVLLGINWKNQKPSPYYTPIGLFVKECESHDIAQEVDYKYAQGFANQGGPVVICVPEKYGTDGKIIDPGHMALVYPQDNIEQDEINVMVCGAGSRAVWGLKSMYDAFLRYGYKPRYFYIKGV